MTCATHPWAIPAASGCPSCWMAAVVHEEHAKQGRRDAKSRDAKVRRFRERAAGRCAADATFEAGMSSGQRRLREQGAANRARAIELLDGGHTMPEVDAMLGRHPGWCSQQSLRHPDLRRAVEDRRAS